MKRRGDGRRHESPDATRMYVTNSADDTVSVIRL
jgi:hypothetical protein